MADVNGAKIPVFVDEEIDDVGGLEVESSQDGLRDDAVKFVLVCNERSVTDSGQSSIAKVSKRSGRKYMSVQAIMPSLPLWKSLKSK